MEVSSLLSGTCARTPILSTGNPNKSLSPSLVQFEQSVSFKTQKYLNSLSLPCLTRLECKSSVQEVEDIVIDEKHKRAGIKRKKLAVFVSGGGSNFRSIHEACISGSVHGGVAVVVTNKRGCSGAEYARDRGILVLLFPESKDETDALSSIDLVAALRKFEVDFILLAGYLKLIPKELIQAYPRSIVNIHPSLLPAFGGQGYHGMKVHKAVISSGARYSGATIHFVNDHYDRGHILAQRVVPILSNDTPEGLAARVLEEEHQLYVEVIAALCEERIIWREDGVLLIRSKDYPNVYN